MHTHTHITLSKVHNLLVDVSAGITFPSPPSCVSSWWVCDVDCYPIDAKTHQGREKDETDIGLCLPRTLFTNRLCVSESRILPVPPLSSLPSQAATPTTGSPPTSGIASTRPQNPTTRGVGFGLAKGRDNRANNVIRRVCGCRSICHPPDAPGLELGILIRWSWRHALQS